MVVTSEACVGVRITDTDKPGYNDRLVTSTSYLDSELVKNAKFIEFEYY